MDVRQNLDNEVLALIESGLDDKQIIADLWNKGYPGSEIQESLVKNRAQFVNEGGNPLSQTPDLSKAYESVGNSIVTEDNKFRIIIQYIVYTIVVITTLQLAYWYFYRFIASYNMMIWLVSTFNGMYIKLSLYIVPIIISILLYKIKQSHK